MDTKLTLNVDSELVKKAKSYAKDKGRSLSDLVESYFKALTHRKAITDNELTPRVKSLHGSFKVPQTLTTRRNYRIS
jgi:hypothetical protein